MTCGIYKLVFEGTDKVYIGQSIDIEDRFKRHLYAMNKGTSVPKVQEAFILYGTPKLEVLSECDSTDLDDFEIETISIYNSINNGFNSLSGGSRLIGTNNPSARYTVEDYYNVLVLLGTPGIPWKKISKDTGVSEYTISHISAKESHLWLKEAFPVEYAKLELIHSTGRNSAYMQGIFYPYIVSPEGIVYEVKCPTHFAKEHKLLQPKLHEVLTGSRDTHRGWHLETYKPSLYPKIQDQQGNLYTIKKGDAVNFAKANNINLTSLRNILSRKQKMYKGWKLAEPLEK